MNGSMTFLDSIARAESFRRTLHSTDVAQLENSFVSPRGPAPSGYETRYQLVLPYHGLFAYNVGNRDWLIDTTRVLCVCPDREFSDVHPIPDVGHAALVVTFATE